MTSAPLLAPAAFPAATEPTGQGMPTAAPPSHRATERLAPLVDTRERVHADDAGKWDFTVLRRDLVMKHGEMEFPLDVGGEEDIRERLAPTAYAFGQICSRLGLPASYLRKCPLILLDQNINFWLQGGGTANSPANSKRRPQDSVSYGMAQIDDTGGGWEDTIPKAPAFGRERPRPTDDEKWLLRARHGTLRAALSERYSPLDNADLLDTLLPILPAHYRVQWMGLQDESFHLRLVDPTRPRTVLPGDDYFAGIHIANSEIGFRSVTVDAMVYRLVCTNGLIALVQDKSLLRRRHIHIAGPRFKAGLEEAVAQAFGATDVLLGRLEHAAKSNVPDPEMAIDRLAKLWQQTEDTAEIAKAALQAEPEAVQHTVYGLVNGFTHAARLLPDENRYELEVLAGQFAHWPDLGFLSSPFERNLGGASEWAAHANRESTFNGAIRPQANGLADSGGGR